MDERLASNAAVWGRHVACWLAAAAAALYLTALVVPMCARYNDGIGFFLPAVLVAVPSVYGGVLGFGMPGRAPWRLLLLGGALTSAVLLLDAPFQIFLQWSAAAVAAPAPAAAAAAWTARRAGLSPNGRLGAALMLALAVTGFFAFANRMKWIPQTGIICEAPIGAG